MIVFDLQCVNGHRFEGWFKDSQMYEEQNTGGLITCPVCNDTEVIRVPTTFGIRSSSQGTEKTADSPEALAEIGRKVADYVHHNFEDVGCNFAKEALKIHYGASEPRSIRGVSTDREEKMLQEEGVRFFKFPAKPASDDADTDS